METVKRRARRWWIGGAICALAIAVGLLARGKDEYAVLRALHPREEYVELPPYGRPMHYFYFTQDADKVAHSVFLLANRDQNGQAEMMVHNGIYFDLRSGRRAMFQQGETYGSKDGSTCRLGIYDVKPTWVERCWLGIKQRLGL